MQLVEEFRKFKSKKKVANEFSITFSKWYTEFEKVPKLTTNQRTPTTSTFQMEQIPLLFAFFCQASAVAGFIFNLFLLYSTWKNNYNVQLDSSSPNI